MRLSKSMQRRLRHIHAVAFALVALSTQLGSSADDQWGDLRGRFLFDGEPPPVREIAVTKDSGALGDTIEDDSLRVNKTNKGISDVIVYLLPPKGKEIRVHSSYERTANAKVKVAMEGGRFVPHVLLMRTTQTMVQGNQDTVGHHARISFLHNAPM